MINKMKLNYAAKPRGVDAKCVQFYHTSRIRSGLFRVGIRTDVVRQLWQDKNVMIPEGRLKACGGKN